MPVQAVSNLTVLQCICGIFYVLSAYTRVPNPMQYDKTNTENTHLLPFLACDSLTGFGSKNVINTILHLALVNAYGFILK
jgi:hypothetical protein